MAAALSAADAAGEPLVVLEGSPRCYGARGFDFAGSYGIRLPLATGLGTPRGGPGGPAVPLRPW